MNQDIKQEWVRRLRSGQYRQGRFDLNSEAGFCCLGVLCEIAADEGVVTRVPDVGQLDTMTVGYQGRKDYAAETAGLPDSVQEWSGLSGSLPEAGGQRLSSLNDNRVPFTEIADIIERNL